MSVAFMAAGAAILAFAAFCVWGAKQVPLNPPFWPLWARREKNPIYFWTAIGWHVAMGLVCIFSAIALI